MGVKTVFAHICCTDIKVSSHWYEHLFGKPPLRRPNPALVEWQFSESAEVQLHEQKEHAGHTNITFGVLPMTPERERMVAAGLNPDPIEETDGYFTMRIRDPDENLIVFASARKS